MTVWIMNCLCRICNGCNIGIGYVMVVILVLNYPPKGVDAICINVYVSLISRIPE